MCWCGRGSPLSRGEDASGDSEHQHLQSPPDLMAADVFLFLLFFLPGLRQLKLPRADERGALAVLTAI